MLILLYFVGLAVSWLLMTRFMKKAEEPTIVFLALIWPILVPYIAFVGFLFLCGYLLEKPSDWLRRL